MNMVAQSGADGQSAPVPEVTLNLAWFERSSLERSTLRERGPAEGVGGLLDRVREGEGLVYNGEGDHES